MEVELNPSLAEQIPKLLLSVDPEIRDEELYLGVELGKFEFDVS